MYSQNRMSEAARLVRQGRLIEATDTLQRLLRGHGQAQPSPTPQPPPQRPVSPIIDIDPATGEILPPRSPNHPSPPPAARAPGPAERATPQRPPEPSRARSREPSGARFRPHTFADAHGTRAYKLFVPSRAPDGPMPLIVMLHGCTQSPDDFAAGTGMNLLAEQHGFLVAYPAQPKSANPQKCWNWFNPADQQRDKGEPALIAGITRSIINDHAVDPRRVYIAGLSAGGAAAAVMAATYPDLYAAVGVHSGLPCGAARDIPSALAAMRTGAAPSPRATHARARPVPTIVFHADKDTTVHPRNAEHIVAQSNSGTDRPPTVTRGQVPGGHAYTRSIYHGPDGRPVLEQWLIHGAGHAWSGGHPSGTYTDPLGPDASREMLRFFLEQPLA